MSCVKKKQVLYIKVEREWRKVVVVGHDGSGILVAWPGTRHISRVELSWLRKRPSTRGRSG